MPAPSIWSRGYIQYSYLRKCKDLRPHVQVEVKINSNVVHGECFGVPFAVSNDDEQALAFAQFAVTTHNETQGPKIRFERIVRATRMKVVAGYDYYLQFQGIDENGDVNVYYAEVSDHPFGTGKHLRRWQPVDDSFSYPFHLIRGSELRGDFDSYVEKYREWFGDFDSNVEKLRMFLPTLSLKYEDGKSHTTFDHTAASVDVVPVYNMIHCGTVSFYASSAVKMYKQKVGKDIFLDKVLHASKECDGGKAFYNLLLKVMNEKDECSFLHAIVEVLELKNEKLVKWHVIDEIFSSPLGKEQIAVGA
ncbi:OLC1v1015517C1 [Oldenlandia corymbosa var. corymbosa]|uniref:OLC1v1015517C1 n=1 Tax=Oldenlandia corymbosa var. corymbosa TaxID=529605 RepID=A0AAV1E3E5_OLDCO|nr:OLC1v1015517C1 [Oldenlandia corymbosa var. corymbosa]